MSPNDLRQLVTELEHIVEKHDATEGTRAWKFRQLLPDPVPLLSTIYRPPKYLKSLGATNAEGRDEVRAAGRVLRSLRRRSAISGER